MSMPAWVAQLDSRLYFRSVDALLTMDGHGAFVWSAYLIAACVVAAMLVLPARRKKRFLRRLAGELKRREGGPKMTEEGD